jgi:hypothetical protein
MRISEKPFTGQDRNPVNFGLFSIFGTPISDACIVVQLRVALPPKTSPQPAHPPLRSSNNGIAAEYLHVLQAE